VPATHAAERRGRGTQSTRPRVKLSFHKEEVDETPLLSLLGGGGGWKLGSSPATEWAIRAPSEPLFVVVDVVSRSVAVEVSYSRSPLLVQGLLDGLDDQCWVRASSLALNDPLCVSLLEKEDKPLPSEEPPTDLLPTLHDVCS
jgi:hypothetical protein